MRWRAVWWGKPGESSFDSSAALCEEVKEGKGSVHRIGRSKTWASSADLSGILKGLYSPGAVDLDATPDLVNDVKPGKKEAPAPKGKPAPSPQPEKSPK